MHQITETGVVIEVEDEKSLIRVDREVPEMCEKCSKACSGASGGPAVLEVHRRDLEVGERVTVHVSQVNAYLSIVLLFALPMVLFAVGALVHGLTGALIGLGVAVAAGCAANALIARRLPEPRVERLGGGGGTDG